MKNLSTAYEAVRTNLVKARLEHKKQYDKRAKELNYEVGDKVLLEIKSVIPPDKCKKFLPKYEGPYRVLKTHSNGTAEIVGDGIKKHVNKNRIIPFFETMIWHDEPCLKFQSRSMNDSSVENKTDGETSSVEEIQSGINQTETGKELEAPQNREEKEQGTEI